MRYEALATDYDGTLANEGFVQEASITAIERLRGTGRRVLMVTGRTAEDLTRIFSRLDLFDIIVAENGAVLYYPANGQIKQLHDPPPPHFAQELRKRGVPGVGQGHVIVALSLPHEVTAVHTIKDLGLELQIIFNKDSVMVLPSGVNKATGLEVALKEVGLSPSQVVGIGDAENDHAFLHCCGCGVAANNALPALKKEADFVTKAPNGRGVIELIDLLIATDLSGITPRERLAAARR